MELDTSENLVPLLEKEYGYDDINSIMTIDKLKCVSYKETYVKKELFGKGKLCCNERVKVVQDDPYVVPKQFVYKKKNRIYMSGDYVSVLLLDSMKQLKHENDHLKETINQLQIRLSNLEKKSNNNNNNE